jgi:hypothetical protein
MPSPLEAELLVPNVVRIKFVSQRNDWLSTLLLQERWTPFEAACVLLGFRPGIIDPLSKDVDASWVKDPEDENEFPDSFDGGADYGREIRDLTKAIATNSTVLGSANVIPSEIVTWAVKNRIISIESNLAQIFGQRLLDSQQADATTNLDLRFDEAEKLSLELINAKTEIIRLSSSLEEATTEINRLYEGLGIANKKAKNTGKHHAETRAKILAAALYHLSNFRDTCVDSNFKVLASELARQIDDKRVFYGFDIDDKNPAASTMIEHITNALSSK